MRLLPVFLFSLLAISHAWNVPLDSEDDDSKENDLFTPVQKEVLEVIDSAMTLIENLKDDNWKKNFEQKGRKLFGNILKELFGIGNEETKHSRVRRAVRHEAIIPAESFDPLVSGTDRLEHVNSNGKISKGTGFITENAQLIVEVFVVIKICMIIALVFMIIRSRIKARNIQRLSP
ncbi:hypothetical protein QR680_008388 [Steinernema hermaphroditum]|uniref:Uncharacterized protein n=1 Tax=Steinernema hermaphroditum TaxID=289476 RepID=A0AA39M7Y5_9BILA|nr:hypothetical protein QR680_008388 [Steinernema hermaphroditum]